MWNKCTAMCIAAFGHAQLTLLRIFFYLASIFNLEYWSLSGCSYKNVNACGNYREVGVSCKQLEVKHATVQPTRSYNCIITFR
jgi:hypothetical protein